MKISAELDKKSKLANYAFELSRKLRVSASRAIAAVHDNRIEAVDEAAKKRLDDLTAKAPFLFSVAGSQIFVSYQEYAEAKMLLGIVKNDRIPAIAVPPEALLTGMGDAVGELKRKFLEELIAGNRTKAKKLLDHAKKIHDELSLYDYPDSIVPGLRRKKDETRIQVNSMLEAYLSSQRGST